VGVGCRDGRQAALPLSPTPASPKELFAISRRFVVHIPLQPLSIFISVFAALILAGCVATGDTRIDNIPMYGAPSIQRPDELKRGDIVNPRIAGRYTASKDERREYGDKYT